jgi:hypothetical protein
MKRPFQTLAAEWLFICKSTTRSKEKTLFTYDTIHRTCLRGGFLPVDLRQDCGDLLHILRNLRHLLERN